VRVRQRGERCHPRPPRRELGVVVGAAVALQGARLAQVVEHHRHARVARAQRRRRVQLRRRALQVKRQAVLRQQRVSRLEARRVRRVAQEIGQTVALDEAVRRRTIFAVVVEHPPDALDARARGHQRLQAVGGIGSGEVAQRHDGERLAPALADERL